MKIAILAHNLYPIAEPFAGGLEMVTYLLCKTLMENGHYVDLYAHSRSDPRFNIIPIEANLHYLKKGTKLMDSGNLDVDDIETMVLTHAMNQISSVDYDIVHNHSLHYVPIIMGNELSCPFITSIHTPTFEYLQRGVKSISHNCNQTFTMVSNSLADAWASLISHPHIIYNGIDLSKWKFKTDVSQKYLFWYGRICPEKGTDYAIKAAVAAGYAIKLAGPISNKAYYINHVAPLLQLPGVDYVGHKSQQEIVPFLCNAKVLLFTSTWEEPYGLTLAESLACGTPVAAFNSGAAGEILTKKTGCIVKLKDTTALVRAIQKASLLLREDCRKRAIEFCSHKVMVNKYMALYKSMVEHTAKTIKNAV